MGGRNHSCEQCGGGGFSETECTCKSGTKNAAGLECVDFEAILKGGIGRDGATPDEDCSNCGCVASECTCKIEGLSTQPYDQPAYLPLKDNVMSRRDWFAAAALQGLLAAGEYHDNDLPVLMRNSLQHADALIAALDEGGEDGAD